MLHFDLSQGCAARALCAALVDLGASLKAAEAALPGLQVRYADKSLDFLDASGRSLQSATQMVRSQPKLPKFKAKLLWHHAFTEATADKPAYRSESKLDPIPAALADKAQKLLIDAGHTLTQQEFCELTAFCVLLSNLDPKGVTSTRVPLSFSPDNTDRDVILKLSESIPVYEKEWPAPSCDAVGLALIKACVSRFGARGESRLTKMGIGFDPEVRALWCEPVSGEPKVSRLVQASATIGDTNLISELVHRLNQIGAKKVWTTQVFDQGTLPKTTVTAIVSESEQNKIVEILLILGQAPDVGLHTLEQHALQKRTVSVTLGKTQKLQVCRVVESLWGDRILRADPLAEDLTALSKATGQLQEIIRADVLNAWKKRAS